MSIVYQIKSDEGTTYTSNIVKCDEICQKILNGGGTFRVRRMKRCDVPMSDIYVLINL